MGHWRRLTRRVNKIATTKMASPALFGKNSRRRCVATNAEKRVTGVMMSSNVKGRDQASGPNISLPPNINFCTQKKKE